MGQLNDPEVVAREYAATERLTCRRLDRTGWLRDADEPLRTLLQAVAEVRPQRALDAGCGDGGIASLLTTLEVVCVDQSEAAVATARERGLTAESAKIEDLPFAAGSFDVVMCNWTLYHLEDLQRGLAELRRVLRPGGRFVGAYNLDEHLQELWSAVGRSWSPDDFGGSNGATHLSRHFRRVERRDTGGEVLWEDRESLQRYLDAYEVMLGVLEAPPGPFPFRASRRNCVFVAETD